MEAEKSHNLPSASWRPREASGMIQSESEGLKTKGANSRNPSPRGRDSEMRSDAPVQSVRQGKRGKYLLPPLDPVRPSMGCTMLIHPEGDLLSSQVYM